MPTVSELRRKARTITVEWVVDTDEFRSVPIKVTYDPSKITMDSQDMEKIGTKTLHDFWRDQMLTYVTGTDLEIEKGVPMEMTAENIAGLEITLVRTILNKINEDAAPK